MISEQLVTSRYLRKARAAHISRLVAAGALVTLPVACGNNDQETFATTATVATTTPATAAPATAAPATETPTTAPVTQAPATAAPTQAPVTAAPATVTPTTAAPNDAGGTAIATEMAIDFTYQANGGGGRVLNPYIAVWVEDADGNLVQTVSLWYQQDRKGTKWLSDLSSWYSVSSGDAATSGATRAAGTYSVAWDGTMADGTAAPAGTYTVFVEAAREKGPHSITSVEVTLDGSATTATLPDNEELLGLTLTTA